MTPTQKFRQCQRRVPLSSGAPAEAVAPTWDRGGHELTDSNGAPVDGTGTSLRTGERGPTLLAVLDACSLGAEEPGIFTVSTAGRGSTKALIEAVGWNRPTFGSE